MLLASLTGKGEEEEVIGDFIDVLFCDDLFDNGTPELRKNKAEKVQKKYRISESLYESIRGAIKREEDLEERKQSRKTNAIAILSEERKQSLKRKARAVIAAKNDGDDVSDCSFDSN